MSLFTKLIRSVSRIKCERQMYVNRTSFLPSNFRYFCNKPRLCNKMFMEIENKYAYDIMKNRGFAIDIELSKQSSSSSLSKEEFENLLTQDWSKCAPQDIFDVFPKFGSYCKENKLCISNVIFDNYIDSFTDNIKYASDEQLISLFYAFNLWPETPSIRTRNFIEVWVALDDACFNRITRFTFEDMFLFISLFYMLNVSKACDFPRKSLEKLAAKAKKLTPEQLVKTLFFVGIQRTPPHDMHNLKVQLELNFSQFSVDDLAIMSMGFFKSKTPIRRTSLVIQIIERVIDNSKSIHEVSLAALLKIIRYSTRVPFDNVTSSVYKLLDTLQIEASRLSVMCNVHLALLGSSKLVLHESCLDSIANVITEKMSQTRIKDLERLVLAFGTLRYKPKTSDNFFDLIIDELRKPEREQEINKHGRSFACCIQYLGLLGLYPIDLMNRVLSTMFLHNTYGKQCHGYGKEILTINNTAEIFCSGHEIIRLTEREITILSKKYTDFVPSDEFIKQYNVTEKMFLDIMKVLREIQGGKEFVVADHILTHHQRGDIIICSTSEGCPLPVTGHFKSSTFGLLRRPPDNNTWTVLVVAGRNGVLCGSQTPTGPFYIKLKELWHLGYCASLVLWNVYSKLDTFEEKEKYLRNCINEAGQNKGNTEYLYK